MDAQSRKLNSLEFPLHFAHSIKCKHAQAIALNGSRLICPYTFLRHEEARAARAELEDVGVLFDRPGRETFVVQLCCTGMQMYVLS